MIKAWFDTNKYVAMHMQTEPFVYIKIICIKEEERPHNSTHTHTHTRFHTRNLK
jgi:hypothetical protein